MNTQLTVVQKQQASNVLTLPNRENFSDLRNDDDYTAYLGDFKLTLGLAKSSRQYEQIYVLREAIYQDKMSYLLNTEDGLPASADKFDSSSYLFYCSHGDRMLASCRYSPAIDGQWDTPQITAAADLVPENKTKMLQIGRLVVAPEYRAQMISEILIWTASNWLRSNTNFQSFYAVCSPALVRFYRHFGSQSVANAKITLPERQNKKYRIVYGSMATVADKLADYITERGWSLCSPHQLQRQETYSQNILVS